MLIPSKLMTKQHVESDIKRLKRVISPLLNARVSHLNEAYARGFGARTYASLLAALKSKHLEKRFRQFERADFVTRLTELTDALTAEVVAAMLDGIKLEVRFKKMPPNAQYRDVAYEVDVQVHGLDPETLAAEPKFFLPDFSRAGSESYRVDSASTFRLDDEYAVTRDHSGRGLMSAKLVDGHWRGGLYVYAIEHQQDDSRCVQSVKAALARAILPVVTPWVHCAIYRPDHYQFGAWRVEIRVGPLAWKCWRECYGDAPITFPIPELSYRLFIVAPEFLFDHHIGKIEGGRTWSADFTSNAIPEDANKMTIDMVRCAILSSLNEALRATGD